MSELQVIQETLKFAALCLYNKRFADLSEEQSEIIRDEVENFRN